MRVDRLLVATRNKGKVAELRDLLAGASVDLLDLTWFPDAPEVEETGQSFLQNASLKAASYAKHSKTWALADDSGLAVDALDGAPGIHSARWSLMHNVGAEATRDADNNRLLLEQLKDVSEDDRTAQFVCALALADESGTIILTCQAQVDGVILREPRGTGGFGYDPLFLYPRLGKTTAECMPEEKHAISHRGRAMRHLVALMKENGLIG